MKEENYRVYLTDSLYTISASLGNTPRMRYYDLLHPETLKVEDETAEERLERFGIKVVD